MIAHCPFWAKYNEMRLSAKNSGMIPRRKVRRATNNVHLLTTVQINFAPCSTNRATILTGKEIANNQHEMDKLKSAQNHDINVRDLSQTGWAGDAALFVAARQRRPKKNQSLIQRLMSWAKSHGKLKTP